MATSPAARNLVPRVGGGRGDLGSDKGKQEWRSNGDEREKI